MRALPLLLATALARPSPVPFDEQEMLRALSYGDPPAEWLSQTALPRPLPLDPSEERWLRLYLGRARPLMQGALRRLRAERTRISAILEEHHLPELFLAVPIVESALLTDVVSRRGAVGAWQLMPETARELGLVVTQSRDERTDLQASTVAACRYLARIRRALGDDDLTLAAYNAGPTRVSDLLRSTGGGGFERVAPLLSPEARNYVPKVHAVAFILEDPVAFGFTP